MLHVKYIIAKCTLFYLKEQYTALDKGFNFLNQHDNMGQVNNFFQCLSKLIKYSFPMLHESNILMVIRFVRDILGRGAMNLQVMLI